MQKQVGDRAAASGITNAQAIAQLLGEKEPSMQFTTPQELGALAVFFCSPAGNNVRGVAMENGRRLGRSVIFKALTAAG